MKIVRAPDRIDVRDNPTLFWMFYSFFVVGGVVVIVIALMSPATAWQQLAAVGIGSGSIAGGVYMLRREPASVIGIDLSRRTLSVTRWSLVGRSTRSYPLGAVQEARLDVTEHTDGGSVYRPVLGLEDGSRVPISTFWYQTDADSRRVVDEVNDGLGKRSAVA